MDIKRDNLECFHSFTIGTCPEIEYFVIITIFIRRFDQLVYVNFSIYLHSYRPINHITCSILQTENNYRT